MKSGSELMGWTFKRELDITHVISMLLFVGALCTAYVNLKSENAIRDYNSAALAQRLKDDEAKNALNQQALQSEITINANTQQATALIVANIQGHLGSPQAK